MGQTLNTISFNELAEYNDVNSLVFIACDFGDMTRKGIIREMDEWMHELKLIDEQKHVKDVKFLVGNHTGRKDYLVVFDSGKSPTNPIARLRCACDFKWTSDYIDNNSNMYQAYGKE